MLKELRSTVEADQSRRLITVTQVQPDDSSQSLIDQGGEDVIYVGISILAVLLILIVGIFSRRLEKAIVFAALASIALMVTLMVL